MYFPSSAINIWHLFSASTMATNSQNSYFAVAFSLGIRSQVSYFWTFATRCVQLLREFLSLNCTSGNTGRLSGLTPLLPLIPCSRLISFRQYRRNFTIKVSNCVWKVIIRAENGTKTCCFCEILLYTACLRTLLHCMQTGKWGAKIHWPWTITSLPIK